MRTHFIAAACRKRGICHVAVSARIKGSLLKSGVGNVAFIHPKMISSKPLFAVDAPHGKHDHGDLSSSILIFHREQWRGSFALNLKTKRGPQATGIRFASSHEHITVSSAVIFAVDAPDGEHDFQDLEEHSKGAERIIDFASSHENAEKINADHAAGSSDNAFAVDAPNGEHDYQETEEHSAGIDDIIDYAWNNENPDQINTDHAAGLPVGAFAVDAPDGEPDFSSLEKHAKFVEHTIKEASLQENAEEVRKHQMLQDETRKVFQKHPSPP